MMFETVDSFKCLINRFYDRVSRSHSKMAQKRQLLQTLLYQKEQIHTIKIHLVKDPRNSRIPTQESIIERQYLSNCSVRSEMSTKNFQDIQSLNYALQLAEATGIDSSFQNFNDIIRTRTRQLFTDPSIYKVILYALFVNYTNIKDSQNQENMIGYGSALSVCSQTVKKVKKSMVSAAHNLKSRCNSKYYAKIRYLFEELIKCLQGRGKKKEELIKIIMEEFDVNYIEEIFAEMEKGSCLLKEDSKRTYLQIKSHCFTALSSVLEFLNIKLALTSKSQVVNLGEAESPIILIVQRQQSGFLLLRQVINFVNNRELCAERQ